MNAKELFHQDGKSAGVFYCGECRNVAKSQELAEECCAPYKCQYCGCDVPRKNFRTACPDCIASNDEKKERERFESAEKLTEWDGPVFCESASYNEGFFPSLAELYDYFGCEANFDEDGSEALPPYAWACNVIQFVSYDVGSIKESLEGYEDWEGDTDGDNELQAALDAWAERNAKVVRWEPDYKRAVLLDQSILYAESQKGPSDAKLEQIAESVRHFREKESLKPDEE